MKLAFSNRLNRRRKASRKYIKNMKPYVSVINIKTPEILLTNRENYIEGTLEFFCNLRKCIDGAIKENCGLHVDFRPLRILDLSSGLILVAELDRYQRLLGVKLVPRTVNEWDKSVVEFLRNIGFFRILKTDIAPHIKKSSKVITIPFITGKNTSGHLASMLRKKLQKIIREENKEYFLKIYEPLIESMKNSIQHAYEENIYNEISNEYFGKRWWMCASFNRATSTVEIVFLDLGLTIPKSLRTSPRWNGHNIYANDTKKMEEITDDTLILCALKYGITITLQSFRGKGFKNIIAPAKVHQKNSVSVISRNGYAMISGTNPDKPFSPILSSHHPLLGTLIRWYIYVPTKIH
ncbi:hypothetical protein ACI01nite_24870 [Acetobacter cibinongensis]|uniref:ATP-binding protein n=1 Tax=Acetobacter cibinongensis TaxID=146475 RepID=A0A0D6N7E5_9PROT|nr:hypothetical protein [Acetobacter cibinongensis]GAN61620.1 hypothetical protein Abci_046_053 [Acetobacter cibinongensis]GBQ17557.1 hypothetical protein AA0482_1946 [Acetobacter cibinongensis NRIC 0482]GEL59885.1 hypothetical protein ACI01nite_24870 [Acetobacter cibinongensis]